MILIKQKPTYIRTKEHIYKRYFIDQAIMNECGYGHCDKDLNPIGETIIKESDTIEELCDMFVFHDMEIGMFTIYPTLLPLQKNSKINVDYEQFGAIWVIDENGIPTLKPVAKMNDKGDLELL